MDWVKQLNIAIRYIEDHLTGTIEYDELAKMLCCSTYQFQRMFAFMNNVPLSEYIRRRKFVVSCGGYSKRRASHRCCFEIWLFFPNGI